MYLSMTKAFVETFILFFSNFGIGLSESNMNTVHCCPSNEVVWKMRTNGILCDEGKDYHCMQRRNGGFAEFCASKSIISLGKCPLTDKGSQIDDHVTCSSNTRTCPRKGAVYISSELYQYPGCFTPCEDVTFATEVFTSSESRTTNKNLPNDTVSTDKRDPSTVEKSSSTSNSDVNLYTTKNFKTDDTSVNVNTRPDGSTNKMATYVGGGDVGGSSSTNYMMTVFTYGGIAVLAVVFVLVIAVCILLLQRFKGRNKHQCKSQANKQHCPVTPSTSRGPLPEIPAIIIETVYDSVYDDNIVLKKDEFKLGTCASSLDVAYESPTTMTKYESLKNVSKDTESERKVYDSLENIKITPSNQNDEMYRRKKCVSI